MHEFQNQIESYFQKFPDGDYIDIEISGKPVNRPRDIWRELRQVTSSNLGMTLHIQLSGYTEEELILERVTETKLDDSRLHIFCESIQLNRRLYRSRGGEICLTFVTPSKY